MVVSTARNETEALCLQSFSKSLGIFNDIFRILSEVRLQSFAEGNSLSSNNVHQRAALQAGENRFIDFLCVFLIVGQNQTAARPTQGFMRSGSYNVSIGNRGRMQTCCNQTSNMCHINEQQSAVLMSNISNAFKINDTRICAGTGNNQLRLIFFRLSLDISIINHFGFLVYTVVNYVEIGTGNINRGSMAQMTALRQVHAHDGIARFQESKIHSHIGACTAMSLYISKISIEQLLSAFDSQGFNLVYIFAAAIITMSWVAFSVFIRQYAAHSLHNCRSNNVFRSD